MTVLGLFLGSVGTDLETGSERYTFGMTELDDGIELIALALGLFGIAEFMNSVNQVAPINTKYTNVTFKDMRPTKADMKRAFFPMWRGTIIGSLCALIPGTGPTIASFVAYATEKKISKHPEDVRHRPDRRRGLPGSRDPLLGAGRLHPDHESRHSRRRGDGAPARRADDPGHRARTAADLAASRHFLGPGCQLLDRQHHAGAAQRAADRHLGEDAGDPLQVPLPERDVLRLHRRLRRQQRLLPGRRSGGHRPVRLHPAAARLPSRADPARLRARPAVRGEFPPRHADLARRYPGVRRAADQRGVHRAVRGPDRQPDLLPAQGRKDADLEPADENKAVEIPAELAPQRVPATPAE